jgi:DNA-binding transcriptional MerR regulator
MLTIGQLASYAGVTTRAVRHYHQIGLLPEPERDAFGYRSYDAAAVVRLIRRLSTRIAVRVEGAATMDLCWRRS